MDLAGEDFECGEQRGGAVALVVMVMVPAWLGLIHLRDAPLVHHGDATSRAAFDLDRQDPTVAPDRKIRRQHDDDTLFG